MNQQIDVQMETRLARCREVLDCSGSVANAANRGDIPPDLRWVAWVCVVLAMGLDVAVAAEPEIQKPTTITEQCTTETCHAGVVNRQVMHGPVAQQECLTCHTYDEPSEHRFKSAFPKNQQCGNCHDLKHEVVVHNRSKKVSVWSATIRTVRPTGGYW